MRAVICATTALAFGATAWAGGSVQLRFLFFDNGYRVPENDPHFDPDAWVSALMFLRGDSGFAANDVRLAGLSLDFEGQFYQHPTHDSIFPQEETLFQTVPSARFDSWIDFPGLTPGKDFLTFVTWTETAFSGGYIAFPAVEVETLPSLQNDLLIGQITVAVDTTLSYPVGAVTTRSRFQPVESLPIAGPALFSEPGFLVIDETGDDSDGVMTLDIAWAWHSPAIGHKLQFFVPADRVRSLDAVDGPWEATKTRINGQFGLLVRSTFEVENEHETGEMSLAFTSAVSTRTLKAAYGPYDASPFTAYGYWAPTAAGPLPGDTNDDGVVNFADLNNILSDFGVAADQTEWLTDLDGSGTVDFADLNAVLTGFGAEG